MKRISNAISGGSLLISGVLILNLVMAGMDWRRISAYGLMHELELRGCAPAMFWISIIFMVVGIIFLLVSTFRFKD